MAGSLLENTLWVSGQLAYLQTRLRQLAYTYGELCLQGATLKPGNRKPESGIGNQNPETETGIRIRNPESGNWKPQITENKFFKFAKIILHSFCR